MAISDRGGEIAVSLALKNILNMAKRSAGILLYRWNGNAAEIFLVHPGGPFWKNKDLASWSIPKGEFDEEDALEAAIREFREETGFEPQGPFIPLQPRKQKSGKLVYAWAAEGNADAGQIKSNFFEMEWPPRSGKKVQFPEVDRAEWFAPGVALQKILPGQQSFIAELMELLQGSYQK